MATLLTKVTSTAWGKGVASAAFQAVDQGADNYFVNTGKTLLLLTRAGGAVAPTFKAIGASKYTLGLAATRVPASPVGSGKVGVYGPFPTQIYGNVVTVGYDTGTDVTAAVIELADTPL